MQLVIAMAKETIYLCNFRVSVEGDWLCLEELDDVHVNTTVVCPAEDGTANVIYFCITDNVLIIPLIDSLWMFTSAVEVTFYLAFVCLSVSQPVCLSVIVSNFA